MFNLVLIRVARSTAVPPATGDISVLVDFGYSALDRKIREAKAGVTGVSPVAGDVAQ